MQKYLVFLPLLGLFISACNAGIGADDEDAPVGLDDGCPGAGIIIADKGDWPAGPDLTGPATLTLDYPCLIVDYRWVGCSDQGLPLNLVTDGAVAESSPTQTRATLRFSENDAITPCAIFERRDTFDLLPFLAGARPSYLTISGLDTVLLVE